MVYLGWSTAQSVCCREPNNRLCAVAIQVSAALLFSITSSLTNPPGPLCNHCWQAQRLCRPNNVHVCTGGDAEFTALMQTVVDSGAAQKLNPKKRPNSYIAWTDPADVARAEKDTWICSEHMVRNGAHVQLDACKRNRIRILPRSEGLTTQRPGCGPYASEDGVAAPGAGGSAVVCLLTRQRPPAR